MIFIRERAGDSKRLSLVHPQQPVMPAEMLHQPEKAHQGRTAENGKG